MDKKPLLPVNNLPLDELNKEASSSDCLCPHFYNTATKKQKEYTLNLISKRLERQNTEISDFYSQIAEIFDYRIYNARQSGKLLSTLHTIIRYNPLLNDHFHEYDRKDLLKTLHQISDYLIRLSEDNEGIAFDYARVRQSHLEFHDVLELREKHIERTILDDGVWVFDLGFNEPFVNLTEDAKIERLRLFLSELDNWDDEEPAVLPGFVKKYLKKAMELNESEGFPQITITPGV